MGSHLLRSHSRSGRSARRPGSADAEACLKQNVLELLLPPGYMGASQKATSRCHSACSLSVRVPSARPADTIPDTGVHGDGSRWRPCPISTVSRGEEASRWG